MRQFHRTSFSQHIRYTCFKRYLFLFLIYSHSLFSPSQPIVTNSLVEDPSPYYNIIKMLTHFGVWIVKNGLLRVLTIPVLLKKKCYKAIFNTSNSKKCPTSMVSKAKFFSQLATMNYQD